MIKKISFIIYKCFYFLDSILYKITNRSFLIWFKDFIQSDSYQSILILNKKTSFFVPNQLTQYRVDTFFTKEPETLRWIDNFTEKKKIIFWDIGANIGLYSIYAALKHRDIEIHSFEPSSSNLRVLSRNISINNLQNRIKINQFPLTNKDKGFQLMMESSFKEGGALHSFGKNLNFEGTKMDIQNNYTIYGFSINYLVKNLDFNIPNYIKIDVDGLEHFILEGANQVLNNENLKSLSIEINENYVEQLENTTSIMKKFNFKLIGKEQSKYIKISESFKNSFNYIFSR
jgi:FkbM family methyltransferase